MEHRMTDIESIREFLVGGKATLTLKSEVTQKHFTFKVYRNGKQPAYWVSMLYGTDYSYIGYLYNKQLPDGNHLYYRLTEKSKAAADTLVQKAFQFFIDNLNKGQLHPKLSVYHEGKCGRCGRPLTDPASIERGFGPHCASL